nr:TnsA endonuclease N-terminal domain-containing protein [Mucilaginibacter sp. L294]
MFLKPVRKIRQSNRSITGKRPSLKTNAIQHFESTLERDHIILLEYNDDVESYVVQPVTICYQHQNRSTRYTPDVAIYYKAELKRKPELCEIKYEAELKEKQIELAAKFNAAKDYASQNGFVFKVITDIEIRTEYLNTIKFLSRYAGHAIEPNLGEMILAQFDSETQLTPKQLSDRFPDNAARALHITWQLLANQILDCDKKVPLNMNTTLWRK